MTRFLAISGFSIGSIDISFTESRAISLSISLCSFLLFFFFLALSLGFSYSSSSSVLNTITSFFSSANASSAKASEADGFSGYGSGCFVSTYFCFLEALEDPFFLEAARVYSLSSSFLLSLTAESFGMSSSKSFANYSIDHSRSCFALTLTFVGSIDSIVLED